MNETNGDRTISIEAPTAVTGPDLLMPSWADADFRGVQVGPMEAADRLSLHFYRREFDCRDGTVYPDAWREPLMRLVMVLEAARFHCGLPLAVLSGYRTPRSTQTHPCLLYTSPSPRD